MDEPTWITAHAVRAIHSFQLAEHGGQDGVRDPGLLESALNRPKNQWAYAGADLSTLAAAYAFGIAKNHPFMDGNKRTAGVVCETFLITNGVTLRVATDDWYSAFLGLAAGDLSEQHFAQWLREHLAPASDRS
ncbi:MAG: type II toxin-antitoxin system death-on-curing family toxin [Planctomycetota bacterium]